MIRGMPRIFATAVLLFFSILPLQYQTIRQWVPLVQFCIFWGARTLAALRSFEEQQRTPLTMRSMRCIAGILDPKFGDEVIAYMSKPKANVAGFNAVVQRAIKKMWSTWHVFNRDLPVSDLRRMPFLNAFPDVFTDEKFAA